MTDQEAIEYFAERIEKENQICNLPTCDSEVKMAKQKHIGYMQLAISAIENSKKSQESAVDYLVKNGYVKWGFGTKYLLEQIRKDK